MTMNLAKFPCCFYISSGRASTTSMRSISEKVPTCRNKKMVFARQHRLRPRRQASGRFSTPYVHHDHRSFLVVMYLATLSLLTMNVDAFLLVHSTALQSPPSYFSSFWSAPRPTSFSSVARPTRGRGSVRGKNLGSSGWKR